MDNVAPDELAHIVPVELDMFQSHLLSDWKVFLHIEEPHREARLVRVKVAIIKYALPSAFKISELGDHEGELSVTWLFPPTGQEKAILGWIWQLVGAEPADAVEHLIASSSARVSRRFGLFEPWTAR